MKKTAQVLGVVVGSLLVPALALAQTVTPVAWRSDGNVVVEVRDPAGSGAAFAWTKGEGTPRFYALCTAAAPGTATWNGGCFLCLADPSKGGPAACGLGTAKKWPKPPAAAKGSPDKKLTIAFKPGCVDGAAGKECQSDGTLGTLGAATYKHHSPTAKPTIKTYFSKDSRVVLVVAHEASPSDKGVATDSFLVLDVGAATSAGATAPWIDRFETSITTFCACKDPACDDAAIREMRVLTNIEELETARLTPDGMKRYDATIAQMSKCFEAKNPGDE